MPANLRLLALLAFCGTSDGQTATPGARPDIRVYKTAGSVKLTAHVFRPPPGAAGKRAPAVVLFHGGGWVVGSPDWVYEQARHYAQYGAVAIAAEYRLCDQKTVTPLDALSDARDIMRWLRENAADLGVDPFRVAAYGVSAGGQLAAALAAIRDPRQKDALDAPDALVLISPAVAVAHDRWFARILLEKASAADLSPDEHVGKGMPPTIVFHGAADTLVPVSGVRRFCQRARDQGGDCQLVEYQGVGHLFTRKLDAQEDDFDPEPTDVADARAKGDDFLAKRGFLPLLPQTALK